MTNVNENVVLDNRGVRGPINYFLEKAKIVDRRFFAVKTDNWTGDFPVLRVAGFTTRKEAEKKIKSN